ncbi:MAG TPA: class I SAM-dependent methyltransferase [Solirubrobacterales bacterium]|nr:class I SAM-dependent methyltransferase [Solirubrobacterales bacterium]
MEMHAHWERVYGERAPDRVSWYEAVPESSLELIDEAGIDTDAPVIDVGGGASRLSGELLDRGYTDLTVVDISGTSLVRARAELDDRADRISWLEADVLSDDLGRSFALWHDRAVFHFMVDPADREAYLAALRRSLPSGGQLVIATFGPEAPPTCSGLAVRRYGAAELAALLDDFELASSREVVHRTPSGKEQQFVYARFVRS